LLIAQGKISLTEVATGQVSVTVATDGTYTISNVRPGLYNIAASADGFKQSLREGVRLTTGERLRVDFVLETRAISEVVTINQDASRAQNGKRKSGASDRQTVTILIPDRSRKRWMKRSIVRVRTISTRRFAVSG